jgi:uncharacterized protein (UPF0264 family)
VQALVSVRTVEEALRVAQAGVPLIDLKEPRAGALGALPPQVLREIVAALRGADCQAQISATVGDLLADDPAALLRQVAATAACGVDVVKVGLWPTESARQLLQDLARFMREAQVGIVPVLLADPLFSEALLGAACEHPFTALMLDTRDKPAGSLLERLPPLDLRRFVARVRGAGRRVGLAGALRLADVPRLKALRPDFAGFRTAVCEGERGGPLSVQALEQLLAALR